MTGDGNVLIFVPLHEEMAYIHAHIGAIGFDPWPRRARYDRSSHKHIYKGTRSGKKLSLQFHVLDADDRDVMGNIAAATSVLSTLGLYKPPLAILVGLAGSLRPDEVKLGDVVISDSAKFLFPDKLRPLDPARESFIDAAQISDEEILKSDKILVDNRTRFLGLNFFRFRRDAVHILRARDLLARYEDHIATNPIPGLAQAEQGSPSAAVVHFGSILGSDWVVDSEDYVRFVLEQDARSDRDWYTQRARLAPSTAAEANKRNHWNSERLLAVDMESYGFLKAAHVYAADGGGNGFSALVVRGISDLAIGKTGLDEQSGGRHRTRAVQNAALVTLDLIARLSEWGLGP